MRLLLVTNDFPPKPGGIQQYLGSLVESLDDDVLVVAPADPQAAPDPAVIRHPRRRFLWPTRGVARWVSEVARDFAPDAVLFGAPYPLTTLGPGLRRSLGVPFWVLCHGAEITIPSRIPGVRHWLKSTLRAADGLLAVSRFTARTVGRLTERDVTTVGAGVDLDRFRPVKRDPDHTPLVVGCVSRFVPRKGQHRVLRAAARLRSTGIEVEVLLVGKGRKESMLRRLARRLGVPTRFEVAVPWDRLPELYGEMDVFCMPCRSRWGGLEVEGLGLVFIEAAATALPVLAGDSGGSPETVRQGVTGFVVRSVDDIVDGVTLFHQDRSRMVEMGRAGRTFVEQEFTWGRVADRLHTALGAAETGQASE